jgi:hypothetical protein
VSQPEERLRCQPLDRADDRLDALGGTAALVGEAHHRNQQRHVGLDGGDDVGGRDIVL